MTMTVDEAQADLAGAIHKLAAGEELIITEGDRPVARLKAEPPPAPQKQRPGPGLWKGKLIIVEDDDEHLKDFAEYMP